MKHLYILAFFLLGTQNAFSQTVADDTCYASHCQTREAESEISFTYDTLCKTIEIRMMAEELKTNQPSQAEHIDSNLSFPFDESFPLPADVCLALGLPASTVIKAGTYPAVARDGFYTISVPL